MLVEEHFRHFDANICVVDWQDWALSEYSISAGKTEMVGNFLGDFIDRMITEKYFAIHDIRLIGHSMGAHIAGFAGQKMKGEIPLIVGLDPAGPMFTKFPLQPIDKRLDTSDAKFVQVIHTDRFIIGSDMNLGHADFYANGGATPQPDCVFPIFQHSRTYCEYIYQLCRSWMWNLIEKHYSSEIQLQSFQGGRLFHRISWSWNILQGNKMSFIWLISEGEMQWKSYSHIWNAWKVSISNTERFNSLQH